MKAIRNKGRALLFALLLIMLPVAALAATAVLSDGFVGWSAIGGSSAVPSTGGTYSLAGAAGQAGGHQTLATGGTYSLNGGYVPLGPAGEAPLPPSIFSWLPFIGNGR